ncbi:glycosyltransferase family 2 protein [Halococcus thailandensis]|uniref:Glycosyltransferase n=1 Tax=Halococcus thailandensis JCM 13552 TaxID=1227457 RepID=M0NBT5_9EURY|nr:glycosyltransferase family 2 protein [Halococcus thailandensis]EMA54135.1 glycosyltransferase [Halococcus thailandensis JCM 13552]
MQLSVVVPTLNGRTQLVACLDALAAVAPESEVVVVNGPSADGTTGMVSERDDVDVLVEVADRNLNVARNAGIEHTTGEHVAFVGYDKTIESGWKDALMAGFDTGSHGDGRAHTIAEGYPPRMRRDVGVVTGPARSADGPTTPESRTITGREVTYFDGSNVAFTRTALEEVDGFDEYLQTGGARDLAHRLAAAEYDVRWAAGMAVGDALGTETTPSAPRAISDGGRTERDWYWKYRALAYRLVKNYGLRPTTARRLLSHAGRDALTGLEGVVRGEASPTNWVGNGRDVLVGSLRGNGSGLAARWRSRDRRNPNGLSARSERAVAVHDWR